MKIPLLVTCLLATSLAFGEGRKFTISAAPLSDPTIKVSIDDIADAEAMDLILTYDPTVAVATEVALGALASNYTLVYNINEPGRVRVGMFTLSHPTGSGGILVITFAPTGGNYTPIFLTRDDINEQQIPAYATVGQLYGTSPLTRTDGLLTSTTLFQGEE